MIVDTINATLGDGRDVSVRGAGGRGVYFHDRTQWQRSEVHIGCQGRVVRTAVYPFDDQIAAVIQFIVQALADDAPRDPVCGIERNRIS